MAPMTTSQLARMVELEAFRKEHEAAHAKGTIHSHPTDPGTPPSGIPKLPAGFGTILRKDFADGHLGYPGDPSRPLLVAQDYPNVHEGDQDPMLGWDPAKPKGSRDRFLVQAYSTAARYVSVHDGFLDLLAEKVGASYVAALVSSFAKADATKRLFDFQYGILRVMGRILAFDATGKEIAPAGAAWHTPSWAWDGWRKPEIDVAEVIGGKLTANLHYGTSDSRIYTGTIPAGWHSFGLVRTATYIAGLLDEAEIWRKTIAIPERMAFVADSKYGLASPGPSTPASLRAQISELAFDPLP